MKRINFILLITLFIACKSEFKVNVKTITNTLTECPSDSILLDKLMSENLLFGKNYVLVDTIFDFIEFRFDTTIQQQNKTITKLIKKDSIPNFDYTKCSKREIRSWKDYKSFQIIRKQTLDKIFEDPYIISGKIDNYKVLKDKTGKDGFMQVSEIYYSTDFKFAVVGLEVVCGWRCGQHQIRLYQKIDEKWYLEMNYITSES